MFIFNLQNQTIIAEWHALVKDATAECGYHFDDSIQHYLIITLEHFTTDHQLASVVIALDFLQALKMLGHEGNARLRQVGDRCLLLSGLFPEQAQRRHVTSDYFIAIGQQAYEQLAHTPKTLEYNNELFHQLSDEFIRLINVLQAMRHLKPLQH